jgi:hypothetical protein
MTSAPVEHVGDGKQMIDLAGADSVKFAEDYGWMAQRFSEFGPSVGSDRTHLSEDKRRQVQRQTRGLGSGKPGDGGKATAN